MICDRRILTPVVFLAVSCVLMVGRLTAQTDSSPMESAVGEPAVDNAAADNAAQGEAKPAAEPDPFGPDPFGPDAPDPFGPDVPSEGATRPPDVADERKPEVTAEQMAALVEQMGDDSYAARHEASQQLEDLGLKAQEALTAGLRHEDPEVGRRCRWILADVVEADFRRRLRHFIVETDAMKAESPVDFSQFRQVLRKVQASFDELEGLPTDDLPGWQRYSQSIGKDAPARELFSKMQEAEPGLLESAASDPKLAATSLKLRFRQIYSMLYTQYAIRRTPPSLGTVSALLFVASDPQLKIPAEALDMRYMPSLLQQNEFNQAATKGPYQPSIHKLLATWLLQPADASTIRQKLQLAIRYSLKDGIVLAMRIINDKKISGSYRAYAIGTLGKLGGKEYAAVLADLLDDETICFSRSVNGKIVPTQVRDMALVWLVHLTEQDFEEYGCKRSKSTFDQMKRYSSGYINVYSIGLDDPSKRDEVLKKWKAYAQKNPLPKKPEWKDPLGDKATVVAQRIINQGGQTKQDALSDEERERKRLQTIGLKVADRSEIRKLSTARELFAAQRYAEAVGLLDDILAAETDSAFRPDAKVPLYRCLKPEAESLLGRLPPAGRETYLARYEASSRQMLLRAVQSGDPAHLETVAARYFHTPAGAEATYLLARRHFSHGRAMHAALRLERLYSRSHASEHIEPALSLLLATCWWRAGMTQQSEDVLLRLRARQADTPLLVAGEEHALFTDPKDALDWLSAIVGPGGRQVTTEGWTMFRGDSMRNAASPDASPFLASKPLVQLTDEPQLRETVRQLHKQYTNERRAALPKMHPLVLKDMIVSRTATGVTAIDLDTGNVRWRAPLDDALRHFLGTADERRRAAQTETLKAGLKRRFWEDLTHGTLSSDGRYVFGVEGLAFGFDGGYQRMAVMPDGQRRLHMEPMREYNLLTAYDVVTGKLQWEIGGLPGIANVRQPGTFFLGPPLPLGGRLYVLAEIGQQDRAVELLELDAETGELISEMLLAQLEQPPEESQMSTGTPQAVPDESGHRRGASPSYADGVLVCRDGKDRFMGIDLTDRSVLWSYEPPEPVFEPGVRIRNVQQRRMLEEALRDPTDRWAESSTTIANSRVLLTPDDAEELICLNLTDGRLEWTVPREDGLYVACVSRGQVVVVGRGSVWAVRLVDGKPAWSHGREPLPPGALPSGRGYLAENHYYLPLSTAEVATVDLIKGRIVARSRSPDGIVPGNLVCYGDAIVSQDYEGIWRFDRLAARRQELDATLKQRPNDPEALTGMAEVALYQGDVSEAVGFVQQAMQLDPNDRSRELLLEVVLDGLQTDFGNFRQTAEQLAPLIEKPEHRRRFLRQLATSQQQAGDLADALATYFQLIELPDRPSELEPFDAARMVHQDSWVGARLAEIHRAAQPDMQAAFDEQIAAYGKEVDAEAFLIHFDFHQAADRERLKLADELQDKKDRLKAEQLLRRVLYLGEPTQRPAAAARLARLLDEADRPAEAIPLYGHLGGELAETICLEGKTGSQLIKALPADHPARVWLESPPKWPLGKVKVETSKGESRSMSHYPIYPIHGGGPFDSDVSLKYDTRYGRIQGHDAQGQPLWDPDQTSSHSGFDMNWVMYGRAQAWLQGHLLIIHAGNSISAIDGLQPGGKTVWSHQSYTGDSTSRQMQMQIQVGMFGRFGQQPIPNVLPASHVLPLAVGSNHVCFQQGHKLMAVDPITGKVRWQRYDLRTGCDLFGDDEILLVTPPKSTEALVLSTRDGRELGRRTVPSVGDRMWTLGRRTLTWKTVGQNKRLTLSDPWTEQKIWHRDFHAEAHPWLIPGDEVAVFAPTGHLDVVALADGKSVFQQKVDPVKSLESMLVLRSSDHYILIANEVQSNQTIIQSYPQMGNIPVHGQIHGFDRISGKKVWTTKLDGHALQLGQPSELPVLTFCGRLQIREENRYKTVSRLLCLDKRTGKILHKEEPNDSRLTWCTVAAKPDDHVVEVVTYGKKLTLTFTDEPDEESADESGKEGKDQPKQDQAEDQQPETAEEPKDEPAEEAEEKAEDAEKPADEPAEEVPA